MLRSPIGCGVAPSATATPPSASSATRARRSRWPTPAALSAGHRARSSATGPGPQSRIHGQRIRHRPPAGSGSIRPLRRGLARGWPAGITTDAWASCFQFKAVVGPNAKSRLRPKLFAVEGRSTYDGRHETDAELPKRTPAPLLIVRSLASAASTRARRSTPEMLRLRPSGSLWFRRSSWQCRLRAQKRYSLRCFRSVGANARNVHTMYQSRIFF